MRDDVPAENKVCITAVYAAHLSALYLASRASGSRLPVLGTCGDMVLLVNTSPSQGAEFGFAPRYRDQNLYKLGFMSLADQRAYFRTVSCSCEHHPVSPRPVAACACPLDVRARLQSGTVSWRKRWPA